MSDVYPEIIEIGGLKVPLDPAVLSPAILKGLRLGKYETPRLKCLAGMIEAGDRIVDIGSGIGFLSAWMAREGRAALIVSIDGHPGVQAYAEQLHRLNGVETVIRRNALVVTAKAAASEKLYISADFWGSSMIPDVKAQTAVVEVPVLSFSELIAEYRPNMLVIDLEVMREYLSPEATSGPLEAMDLTGVDKVVVHLPIHLGGQRGIRRVFDFFSAQDFYYNIDHSRLAVVLFSRIRP
jgi:FkbM family methyltransferase